MEKIDMKPFYQKARKVFQGTPIRTVATCPFSGTECVKCTDGCRFTAIHVFSTIKNKCIGWFEPNGNLVKTNPKPSKQYRKRILGKSDKKGKRVRKHWLAKFQSGKDRKDRR